MLASQAAMATEMSMEKPLEEKIKATSKIIADTDNTINRLEAVELKDEIELIRLRDAYVQALRDGKASGAGQLSTEATRVAVEEASTKAQLRRLMAEESEAVALLSKEQAEIAIEKSNLNAASNIAQLQAEERDLAQVVGQETFARVKNTFKQ